MKKIILILCILLLALSACTDKSQSPNSESANPPHTLEDAEDSNGELGKLPIPEPEEPLQTDPPAESTGDIDSVKPPVNTQEPEVLSITDMEHWLSVLEQAIINAHQMPIMDIASADFSQWPDLDAKNLYYELLKEHREYCYAYDLNATVTENQMRVNISYMPYRTGDYPADFSGESVGSLSELFDIASSHLGEESVAIRITDKEILVDDMNAVLSQLGGGYLICQLSRDGTAIQFSPNYGLTMEDSLSFLSQVDDLAEKIVAANITDNMSDTEKIKTLYEYLTKNVTYDQQYYSDPANMSLHSRTAFGALNDNIAICGGYALAFQRLLEQAGIRCYTVSGSYNGENHMWCAVLVDGELLYYDPTADRETDAQWWRYCGVTGDKLFGHSWDDKRYESLLRE